MADTKLIEPPNRTQSDPERLRFLEEQIALLDHNLRNPLNAISAAVEVLNRTHSDAPSAVRARAVIANQARRIAAVVTSLNLARSGGNADGQSMLEFRDVVRTSLLDVKSLASARRRTVHADLAEGRVPAKRGDLAPCVRRMLEAALTATPDGGSLSVLLRPSGGLMELSVYARDALLNGVAFQVDTPLPYGAVMKFDVMSQCARLSLPGCRTGDVASA
jgi:signal transduction histidine kinase